MRFILHSILVALLLSTLSSFGGGKLILQEVTCPSLSVNRMGIPDRQKIAIYLPPSYQKSTVRFPVLYLLPNFSTPLWRYTGGSYQGFHIKDAMDKQIMTGAVREMIVVMPNALNFLGGSWYRNSPLAGNWEDYVVRDVVQYVDSHFRTMPKAGARGLAGHGMGGTGALELALKHSDIFGAVYAMSPGLFDQDGLQDFGILDEKQLKKWQAIFEQWKSLDEVSRRSAFRDYVQTRINSPSRPVFLEGLHLSYAVSMAGNLALPYPHMALPISRQETNLVLSYENGFGNWREKLSHYKAAGYSLSSITIEYGRDDANAWIRRGSDHLSRLMTSMGITNTLTLHEGGHDSTLGRRLEMDMLPAISGALRGEP